MRRPGLVPIAVQKGSLFYVTWTSLDPWVRRVLEAHKLTAARLKLLSGNSSTGFSVG